MTGTTDQAARIVAGILEALGPAASPIWLAVDALLLLTLAGLVGRELLRGETPPTGLFVAVILLLVAWARFPGISLSALGNPDESFWITTAAVFRVDPRPWLAVDTTTGGPLTPVPLMVAGWLWGEIGWGVARVAAITTSMLMVALMYLAVSVQFGGRIARFAVLPLVLTVAFMRDEWNLLSFNGEIVGNLLIAAGLLADAILSRRLTGDSDREPGLAIVSLGLILGLVPWVKLQVVPIAAVIGVLRLYDLVRRKRWTLSSVLIAAGLAPTVLFVAYLGATGAVSDFWISYVLHNFHYARSGLSGMFGGDVVPFSRVLLTYPFEALRRPELLPAILVPVGLLIVAGVGWVRNHRRPAGEVSAALLLTVVAAYTTIQTRQVFGHYLLLLLPPLTLLTAALLAELLQAGPVDRLRPRDRRVVLAFVVFGFVVPAVLLPGRHNDAFDVDRRSLTPASSFEAVTEAIREFTDSGDRVAIWGWAAPIWITTGTLPGTRDVHTARQLLPGELQPYFVDRFATDMAERQPILFVDAVAMISHFSDVSKFGHHNFDSVRRVVDTDFRLVAEVDGVRVFLRREAVDRGDDRAVVEERAGDVQKPNAGDHD